MKILLVHLCLALNEIFIVSFFFANTCKVIKSGRFDGQKYHNDKIESRDCLMTLLSMTAMALMTRPLMRLSIWQNRKSLQ